MDVNIQPSYSLTANDKDITAVILDRFVSMTLTDETGENSDSLEIVLADHNPDAPIAIPPTGAELALSLGYDGALTKKGIFVCDKVSISGWPQRMTIHGAAAPWDETPKGKIDFQSHKTRSWKVGTTIGAMVQKMASEHGMAALVSPDLAAVQLPHVDQSEESDMNLLLRLAKKYDAIAKPAGGKLIFTKRGEAKTTSGADLPVIDVKASECGAFNMEQTTRESAGTVVAYWHAKRAAKRVEVTVGSGEPVKRLKQYFPTAEMAQAAAQAEFDRRSRGGFTLSVNVPGNPQLTAECLLALSGFRPGVNGRWLVKRVQHVLSKGQAYRCVVDCEQPNYDVIVKPKATAAAPAVAVLTEREKAAQYAALTGEINALNAQSSGLLDRIEAAQAAGDLTTSAALLVQVKGVNADVQAKLAQRKALQALPTVG